jgi:hypothetical protein
MRCASSWVTDIVSHYPTLSYLSSHYPTRPYMSGGSFCANDSARGPVEPAAWSTENFPPAENLRQLLWAASLGSFSPQEHPRWHRAGALAHHQTHHDITQHFYPGAALATCLVHTAVGRALIWVRHQPLAVWTDRPTDLYFGVRFVTLLCISHVGTNTPRGEQVPLDYWPDQFTPGGNEAASPRRDRGSFSPRAWTLPRAAQF